MKKIKCGKGLIYELPMSDIEYIGCFQGLNGNEEIKSAYARIKKLRGREPDFFFNAELFDFVTRKAASDVVCGGVVHRLTESYGFAFPDNKKAVFSYKNNVGAKDYIGAYPVLIRNGELDSSMPSGIGGNRGRTAIGEGNGNLYIALVPDGSGDVSLSTLRFAMLNAGAVNAINLDGGGSTQFYAPSGNFFSGRLVRGFVGVWLKKDSMQDMRVVKGANSVRVRSGPGYGYKRIDALSKGERVTVYGTSGVWCRIGDGRWMHSFYLKEVK